MRRWPLVTGGLAAATGWTAYNAVAPKAQGFGRTFVGTPGTVRVLWEEGYIPILWSVTLWDWSKGVTTEKIMRKANRQIRGGDVILLHDGCDVAMGWDRSHSIEATERIITPWKSEGFEFVTIPELIVATGFDLQFGQ